MSGGGTQKVTTNLSFFFLFQSVDPFQLGSGFEGFFYFFSCLLLLCQLSSLQGAVTIMKKMKGNGGECSYVHTRV